ncbi:glycerophosphodiester phosphodiesterase [Lacticaseibacillus sp. GG6-2]
MSKSLIIAAWCALYLALCGFVVVGHRGDPLHAPEETFQSDKAAFTAGANYVELDIQESKDGVLVIQHDPTLLRTTGSDVTIASSNFAQIQQYHTKNGESIHSLEELFKHYQDSDTKFLIETKIEKGVPHPQLEKKLAALVIKYHMQKRVMFHSFSLKSLKRLQKLLPDVPRIFIVGSLKRITFAVFPYVTGINISSKLVTAKLVSDLHHIGQKVYVWDEMNENRQKWRWLVNIPIDGVVTNYPHLAYEYQALTKDAQSHPVSALATNNSTQKLAVYMNPYQPIARHEQVAPGATFTALKAVTSKHRTYYQIGDNAFVASTTVNLAPWAGWANLLVGQAARIASTPAWRVPLRAAPTATSAQVGWAQTNTRESIQAVKLVGHQVWCQLSSGWVKAQQLKVAPRLSDATTWLQQFNQARELTHPQLGLGQMPDDVCLNLEALGMTLP